MKKLWFLIAMIFSLSVVVEGKNPEWFRKLIQLKPLKSSKQDVERIFAPSKITDNFVDGEIEVTFYETSQGRIVVRYSTGKCSTENEDIYKVNKGVMITIIFLPNSFPGFSDFEGNKKLERTRVSGDPGWHYINSNTGVDFSVGRGRVITVKLSPTEDYSYLKCTKKN